MLLGLRIRVVNLEHLISRIYIPALGHPDQDCRKKGKNDVTIPPKSAFYTICGVIYGVCFDHEFLVFEQQKARNGRRSTKGFCR